MFATRLIVSSVLVGACYASSAQEPSGRSEPIPDKLSGTWEIVSVSPPRKSRVGVRITFKMGRVTATDAEKLTMRYKANTKTMPYELDWIHQVNGPDMENPTYRCIFMFRGEELVVCAPAEFTDPRPVKFKAKGGCGLMTLKRVKTQSN